MPYINLVNSPKLITTLTADLLYIQLKPHHGILVIAPSTDRFSTAPFFAPRQRGHQHSDEHQHQQGCSTDAEIWGWHAHVHTPKAERNSLPSSHNTSHHTRSSGTNKHTSPKCSRRDPPANCTDSLATVHGRHALKCTHTSTHSLHGTCTCHNRLPSDTHALRFLPPGLAACSQCALTAPSAERAAPFLISQKNK